MKTEQKTMVLIHGQFLVEGEWSRVMWGDPEKGILGVIPKGLKLVGDYNAELLYLCSGIPKVGGREFSPNAKEFTFGRDEELRGESFILGMTRLFVGPMVFDEEVQTTRDEITRVALVCATKGFKRLVQVTAPKHAFRALEETMMAKEKGEFVGVEVVMVTSDVDFTLAKASEVAILEPSHRHDVLSNNFSRLGRASIALMRSDFSTFKKYLADWQELLEKKYNTPVV